MKWLFGLLLGIGAGTLFGPAIAAELQWPNWAGFLLVAIDGFLLIDVPYQFSEFLASLKLHLKGYGVFVDGCAISFLLFIVFCAAPLILAIWIALVLIR